MGFCKNCGTVIDEGALFCNECGMRIESDYVQPEEVKTPKKKSWKKIILFSIIGLLVAAAIVALIVLNTPKYKVLRGLNNTIDDLSEFYENCDNLVDAVEAASDNIDSEKFSANVKYNYEWYEFGVGINYDGKNEVLNGSFEDYSDDFEVCFSADAEHTMFSFPDIIRQAYYFNNETFGSDFADSGLREMWDISYSEAEMYRDVQFQPFDTESDNDAYSSAFKTFLKSVEVEKSNMIIPGFSGKVYAISYSNDDLIKLIEDCIVAAFNGNRDILNNRNIREAINNVRDELMDTRVDILVGIERGKLVALDIRAYGDGFAIVLSGDNVWNRIAVYEDGDVVLSGSITETENGFEAEFNPQYGSSCIIVKADDARGEIRCTDVYGSHEDVLFKLNYSCMDKSATFSLNIYPEYSDNQKIDLSISPLQSDPTMLAESAVDIFSLSENEIYNLFGDLYDEIG